MASLIPSTLNPATYGSVSDLSSNLASSLIGYNSTASGFSCSGTANFESDIIVKGKNLTDLLEAIEQRLCIVLPDLEKLEKFQALRVAYEQYKLVDALCK